MLERRTPSRLLSRPRGLWKHAREVSSAMTSRSDELWQSPHQSSFESDTSDNEHADSSTSTLSLRHFDDDFDDTGESSEEYYFTEFTRKTNPFSTSKSWSSRKTIMTSSTAAMATRGTVGSSDAPDHEDWQDLKDLFARATEQYEEDDPAEALPTLRGVIHECHRFNRSYPDPTVVFLPQIGSPDANENQIRAKFLRGRKWKLDDLPTSFHTIEGSALFLMGTLIAQNPSLALEGEPDNGVFYWAYALDVFETGQTLQSRFCSYTGIEVPEDWRMALMWGRTYVAIAEETIAREQSGAGSTSSSSGSGSGNPLASMSPLGKFTHKEPTWPPESPFYSIVQRRPPITHRMSLRNSTAHELMVLAMDQFSRGIFHMPHPERAQRYHAINTSGLTGPLGASTSISADAINPASSPEESPSPPNKPQELFSRAKELFAIATDILSLADDQEKPDERQQWASWAESIFEQMKLEGETEAWRGPLNRARARSCIIAGSAGAVQLEPALERGDDSVLDSEEADEARECLERAIELIEKCIGSSTISSTMDEGEKQEMQKWLLEALVTLANLTKDEKEREQLYERARIEGEKQNIDLDMDVEDDGDEQMDST